MYYYNRDVEEIDVYTRPVVSGYITDGSGTPREAIIPGQTAYTGFYVEDASGSANTLSIKKSGDNAPTLTVEKSADGKNWSSMGSTSTTNITATIPANGKLFLRCNATTWGNTSYGNVINCSGNFNVGGNIMSLLYGSSYRGNETSFPSSSSYNFAYLFSNDTTLLSAENLILPSTVNERSYMRMFLNCSALTVAPQLPAISLSSGCYTYMFSGCSSLVRAPYLPAETIPTLAYYYLFYNCSSLNYVNCNALSGTENCYYWVYGVASSGNFIGNANAGQIWNAGQNGVPNGWSVTPSGIVKPADYFYIKNISSNTGTINVWKNGSSASTLTVYKSTDGFNWETAGTTSTSKSNISITIQPNTKVFLKVNATRWGNTSYHNSIYCNVNHLVGGNLLSLLWGDDFVGKTEFPSGEYSLKGLFRNDTYLKGSDTDSYLKLPVTKMRTGACQYMFANCGNITELPAYFLYNCTTTLTPYCFQYMFQSCSKLETPPYIYATSIDYNSAMDNMFAYCSNLKEIRVKFTKWPSTGANMSTYCWTRGLPSTGTFYKPSSLSNLKNASGNNTYTSNSISGGTNAIPYDWTVSTW